MGCAYMDTTWKTRDVAQLDASTRQYLRTQLWPRPMTRACSPSR
jgi:hypothetical protein